MYLFDCFVLLFRLFVLDKSYAMQWAIWALFTEFESVWMS